eukprot:1145624-Pelagomonas_calceolata.AAC.5
MQHLTHQSTLGLPTHLRTSHASRPSPRCHTKNRVLHFLQVNMDYTALRDFLKAGDWRKAEDETRALLIRLAGEDAMKRGWVYFTEIPVFEKGCMNTCMNMRHAPLWLTSLHLASQITSTARIREPGLLHGGC